MRHAKPTLLPSEAVRRRPFWVGSGVFFAFVIVAGAVWFAWPRQQTVPDILSGAGYFELAPPSTLSGPGTINTVELLDDGKVALNPTCDMRPELLVAKMQKSQTIDRELLQSLDKKLNISGQIAELFGATVGLHQIDSIQLEFKNASILLVSDEALISARNYLLKGPCEEAVLENISEGGRVCQTRAVLEADVAYVIKYNDSVSLDDRAQLTSEAAARLNLNAHQTSTDRITGRKLFVGVKLAPHSIFPDPSRGPAPKCVFTN